MKTFYLSLAKDEAKNRSKQWNGTFYIFKEGDDYIVTPNNLLLSKRDVILRATFHNGEELNIFDN